VQFWRLPLSLRQDKKNSFNQLKEKFMTTATITESEIVEAKRSSDAFITVAVSERYHYLDNLRAIAMLAGVLLHAGMGFSVMAYELWPSADKERSIYFDFWTCVLHTFRMPLFFLIAGFFAHYLVSNRGLKYFVKNRLMRIGLPFVIFWPLMLASLVGLMIYAAFYLHVDTPVIKLIKFAIENPDQMQGQKPPLSTTHLWFLYYLIMFSMGTALAYRFVKGGARFYDWVVRPWGLFVALPLLTAVVMSRELTPHMPPDSFMPSLSALAFYGLFYYVGWVFFVKQSLVAVIRKALPWLTLIAVIAAVLFCLYLPEPLTLQEAMASKNQGPEFTPVQAFRSLLTGVLAWYLSFLSLWLAYSILNRENAALRYISDGSYWVYIINLPLVAYLQYIFHNQDLPILLEFVLISSITLGVGYLSYALLVRRTPIGWMLNGRKTKAN
jgi:glucans biosynthesis protein C